MAFLTAETFPLTGDNAIDAATTGARWVLGAERTIHWAITGGLSGEQSLNNTTAFEAFALALDTVDNFIDLDFVYGGYFDNPIAAGDAGNDLVFAPDAEGALISGATWAIGYFPNWNFIPTGLEAFPNGWDTQGGDMFYNMNHPSNFVTNFQPGSDGFWLILHEVGHTLGLKHTFDDGAGGRPTLQDLGVPELDKDWVSIMSYSDDLPELPNVYDPAAPMVLDVVALQYLYGANPRTNAGDDTHILNETVGYQTVWDASGQDNVGLGNVSEGWVVQLPDEAISNLSPPNLSEPVKIGWGLPISQFDDPSPRFHYWLMGDMENLVGSDFGDQLWGNQQDNVIIGGLGDDLLEGWAGNDTIRGGDGLDYAFYSGNPNAYTLAVTADGTVVIDRREDGNGTDTILEVEVLEFEENVPIIETPVLSLDLFDDAAKISLEAFLGITEIYIAYFNRAPDALGLTYWASEFQRGFNREQIAESFFVQPETMATYPDLANTESFVREVYNNVLGRDPDQLGFDYWVGELRNNPEITEPIFILAIINGAIGPDVGYLRSKSDVGLYFAVERGMSNLDNSRAVMELYDGSDGSIAAANAETDRLYDIAIDPMNGEFLMPVIGVLDDGSAVA